MHTQREGLFLHVAGRVGPSPCRATLRTSRRRMRPPTSLIQELCVMTATARRCPRDAADGRQACCRVMFARPETCARANLRQKRNERLSAGRRSSPQPKTQALPTHVKITTTKNAAPPHRRLRRRRRRVHGPAHTHRRPCAWTASVDSILEDIKGLTLVEASELVSKIEETFGVDASSAPVAMAVAGGAGLRRRLSRPPTRRTSSTSC